MGKDDKRFLKHFFKISEQKDKIRRNYRKGLGFKELIDKEVHFITWTKNSMLPKQDVLSGVPRANFLTSNSVDEPEIGDDKVKELQKVPDKSIAKMTVLWCFKDMVNRKVWMQFNGTSQNNYIGE